MLRNRMFHPDGGGVATLERLQPRDIVTKDDLTKAIHDLFERVNVLSDRGDIAPGSPERVNLERAFADLGKEVSDLKTAFADANRTAPSSEPSPITGLSNLVTSLEPPKGMSRLHFNLIALAPEELSYAGQAGSALPPRLREKYSISQSWQARIRELQALNDLILLTDLMLCGNGDTEYAQRSTSRSQRIKGLKLYKDWANLVTEFQRTTEALDTQTAGHGLEWVPTLWSSTLIGLIQAQLVVANLFSRFPMPSATYTYPLFAQDTLAYKVAENVEETGATAIPAQIFTTSNMSLTAVKLATRMLASSEITEDSIIGIAPTITANVSKSIARAIDDCILNGDTTGNQDADISGSTDRRTCWDGLRKYALAYTGAQKPSVDAGAASPITFSDLMTIKKNMTNYGAQVGQGTWITGYRSIIELMLAKDANDNQIFLTLEKYGPNFVAMTGELGRVAGSPVILSEFCREDLDTTGVNSGNSSNDIKGCIQYVNRECFTLGERRALTITRSAERYIEMDQLVFVGTWRGDFQPYYAQPANKVVGILYNVA